MLPDINRILATLLVLGELVVLASVLKGRYSLFGQNATAEEGPHFRRGIVGAIGCVAFITAALLLSPASEDAFFAGVVSLIVACFFALVAGTQTDLGIGILRLQGGAVNGLARDVAAWAGGLTALVGIALLVLHHGGQSVPAPQVGCPPGTTRQGDICVSAVPTLSQNPPLPAPSPGIRYVQLWSTNGLEDAKVAAQRQATELRRQVCVYLSTKVQVYGTALGPMPTREAEALVAELNSARRNSVGTDVIAVKGTTYQLMGCVNP